MPQLRSSPMNANPNSPTKPIATPDPDQNEPQLPGGTAALRRRAPGVGAPTPTGMPMTPPGAPPPAVGPELAAFFATLPPSPRGFPRG